MSEERHMDRSCGCQMFFTDDGDAYATRVKWCEEHGKLADALRRILNDFDLILGDIEQKEGVH